MPTDYAAMTDEQIDLLIAERVYGWTRVRITQQYRVAGNPPGADWRETMGRFSQDANVMLGLVVTMQKRGWEIDLCFRPDEGDYAVARHPRHGVVKAYGPRMQRAAADVSLKALDVEAPC